jgi:hypothetical protein
LTKPPLQLILLLILVIIIATTNDNLLLIIVIVIVVVPSASSFNDDSDFLGDVAFGWSPFLVVVGGAVGDRKSGKANHGLPKLVVLVVVNVLVEPKQPHRCHRVVPAVLHRATSRRHRDRHLPISNSITGHLSSPMTFSFLLLLLLLQPVVVVPKLLSSLS